MTVKEKNGCSGGFARTPYRVRLLFQEPAGGMTACECLKTAKKKNNNYVKVARCCNQVEVFIGITHSSTYGLSVKAR